jgi:hypothetical protein
LKAIHAGCTAAKFCPRFPPAQNLRTSGGNNIRARRRSHSARLLDGLPREQHVLLLAEDAVVSARLRLWRWGASPHGLLPARRE